MVTAWFLCPYDTEDVRGKNPKFHFLRHVAMLRHFPFIPNPEGVVWDEVETLGNNALVRVDAPDEATLERLRADADFVEMGSPEADGRMRAIGFSQAEIEAAKNLDERIALVGSVRAIIAIRGDGNGLEVRPGRRPATRPPPKVHE